MECTRKSRVNLSFEVVGSQTSGHKPPIIFLHGLAAAKETWIEVIRPIADATGRKAYAYDARNHGDSDWSDEFDYRILHDDLLHFMQSIHAEKAVLIGHSMGAITAMFFAANEPERVDKLVIEDMKPGLVEKQILITTKQNLQFMLDAVEYIPPAIKDLDEAKNLVYGILRSKNIEYRSSDRQGCIEASNLPICQEGETGKFCWKINFEVFDKFLSTPIPTSNGVFPGPTLMLYGAESSFKVNEDRENIRQVFPNSQFRAVEGAKHSIHLKYPEIFAKEVVEFLNQS